MSSPSTIPPFEKSNTRTSSLGLTTGSFLARVNPNAASASRAAFLIALYPSGSIFLKAVILQPVPPETGKLHFTIVRNVSLFNIVPSYTLYLEKNNFQKF